MLTTLVGLPLSEIDTPAMVIDLDAFERNIDSVAKYILGNGVQWRPHSKGHKSPAIAHKQIAAGAIGVTCAKLGEAEVMAANGIRDILVSNQVVGPIKTRRLAALCHHADVIVAVDNPKNVDELEAAAAAAGSRPRILIEYNNGMERCGVDREGALALARQLAACKHLRFAGLMAWEGHTMAMKAGADRDAEIVRAIADLVSVADAIRAEGIPVDIVSVGGSGTYMTSAKQPGVTEIQAGNAIFGDIDYIQFGANVEPALSLMAQVVSRPNPTRVMVDAGRKSVDPSRMQPVPQGLEITGNIGLSAEHGTINLARPSETPDLGDRVYFRIGYSDQCNHLHENFVGVRNGIVEAIWPTLGRGKLQ